MWTNGATFTARDPALVSSGADRDDPSNGLQLCDCPHDLHGVRQAPWSCTEVLKGADGEEVPHSCVAQRHRAPQVNAMQSEKFYIRQRQWTQNRDWKLMDKRKAKVRSEVERFRNPVLSLGSCRIAAAAADAGPVPRLAHRESPLAASRSSPALLCRTNSEASSIATAACMRLHHDSAVRRVHLASLVEEYQRKALFTHSLDVEASCTTSTRKPALLHRHPQKVSERLFDYAAVQKENRVQRRETCQAVESFTYSPQLSPQTTRMEIKRKPLYTSHQHTTPPSPPRAKASASSVDFSAFLQRAEAHERRRRRSLKAKGLAQVLKELSRCTFRPQTQKPPCDAATANHTAIIESKGASNGPFRRAMRNHAEESTSSPQSARTPPSPVVHRDGDNTVLSFSQH